MKRKHFKDDDYEIIYIDSKDPKKLEPIELSEQGYNPNLEDFVEDLIYSGFNTFKLYIGCSNNGCYGEFADVKDGKIVSLDKKLWSRLFNSQPKFDSKKKATNKIKDDNSYRGCKGVNVIWHGEWSDPELEYEDKTFNYWDIEDALWENFLEETGYTDKDGENPEVEEEFDKYVQENCKSYLDDVIAGGYFNDSVKEKNKMKKTKVKDYWKADDAFDSIYSRVKSHLEDGDELEDAVADAIDDAVDVNYFDLAQNYVPESDVLDLYYDALYDDLYSKASEEESDEDLEDSVPSKKFRKIKR